MRFWGFFWVLLALLLPAASQAQQAGPTRETNQSQEDEIDPWGAKRSFGMATIDLMLSNLVPWAFNEFPRDAAFGQVNPSSWLHNIEKGFGWDDNHFSTNQFAHPFQGALYFNSARSNGHSFWESAPWPFVGSFIWECCGETHLMSLNDFINTGMGGIALGEMLYRTTSLFLDNTATGGSRVAREVGGTLVNPARGFNRILTGRVSKVSPNPTNPWDKRPEILSGRIHGGLRGFSEDIGASEIEYKAFLNLDLQYGSPFLIERNRPFEFFLLSAQINFGDKKGLGKLTVHANLFHKDIGDSEKHRHRLMVLQHFDYVNNKAYEFGGQSVGLGVLSAWELGEPGGWGLFTVGEGFVSPMAAVNSDFAFVAEIPGTRENLRDYDFGLGAGAGAGVALVKDTDRFLDLVYSVTYINTLNGSVENGSDATHFIHSALARLDIPVSGTWGVGADYELFLRNSYYSPEEFKDTSQKSPQFRLFATWRFGDWGPTGIGG